jgi:hypothetical protein
MNYTTLTRIVDPATGEFLSDENVLEVFDTYDSMAVLFAFRNNSGIIYVTVWAKVVELLSSWICAEISPERFQEARESKIELRDIFTKTESGSIYMVNFPYDRDKKVTIEEMKCDTVSDDLLPGSGEYLYRFIPSAGNSLLIK